MSTLLDVFTWWPWSPERGPIRQVQHLQEAPGLVTLSWRTDVPCPTRIGRLDGSDLYRDKAHRQRHRVTLTGGPGYVERIEIRANDMRKAIEIVF